MRKVRVAECLDMETHPPHDWVQGFWWSRKYRCPGVMVSTDDLLSPNERRATIYPCSAEGCEECVGAKELPHKHYLKFGGYAWTSRPGEPYREYPQRLKDLMFQCLDPFCLYEVRITRYAFESALLKGRIIEQTWPS